MIGLRDETGSAPPPPSHAPALAAKIFAEDGWLQTGLQLDHRPQQEEMARAVAAAMKADEPLLFEAGTGVGKSLAYLVPGLIHAIDTSRQLIVSTHTISLQEQLETSDLPKCRRLFKSTPTLARYADFKSAVLVGKSNYLCTTRLGHALADRSTLFADADYDELKRLSEWADQTETGLRHDLRPPPRAEVWDAVNADSSSCSRKHCDGEKCFYQRARGRMRSANLVIINHALLFALISAGGAQAQGTTTDTRGVLFADDFLVLDEAHTVPEVATANFGLSLSSYGVDRALKYLFNPRTKRGLFRKVGGPEAQQLVVDALDASKLFFDFLAASLLAQRPVVRVREEGVAEPTLDGPLGALYRLLGKLGDKLEDGRERDELLEQKQRVKTLQSGVSEWLTLGDKGHVYWAERGGRKQTIVALRSAPIDVAPELQKHLFRLRHKCHLCQRDTCDGWPDRAVRCTNRRWFGPGYRREIALRFRAQHARLRRLGRSPAFAPGSQTRPRCARRLRRLLRASRKRWHARAVYELHRHARHCHDAGTGFPHRRAPVFDSGRRTFTH